MLGMTTILALIGVAAILIANEFWARRTGKTHGELSRKTTHIAIGGFVAFWPYFMPWWHIIVVSVLFLLVVLVSRFWNVFKTIHSIDRFSWGEIFFAIAIGATAYLTNNPAVFAVAILHLSLADGLAAVIGITYGGKTRYKVGSHDKSVVGTATFFIISVALLLGFSAFTSIAIPIGYVLAVAAAATLLENIGSYGVDNLLVPLVILAAL